MWMLNHRQRHPPDWVSADRTAVCFVNSIERGLDLCIFTVIPDAECAVSAASGHRMLMHAVVKPSVIPAAGTSAIQHVPHDRVLVWEQDGDPR